MPGRRPLSRRPTTGACTDSGHAAVDGSRPRRLRPARRRRPDRRRISARTEQAPGAPESTARGDVLATYACGNADASVIVEIDLHNTPASARQAADYNTSNDQRS